MTAHTNIKPDVSVDPLEAVAPTLDERLRYIDITFECAKEARRQLVEQGKVSPFKPAMWEIGVDPEVIEQGELQGNLAAKLIARKVREEGLNPAVLSEGRVSAAYWEEDQIAIPHGSYVPAVPGGVA